MADKNKMPFVYWSDKAFIEYLQDKILVWSILYYEMDTSLVSNYIYDRDAQLLYKHMLEHPAAAWESRYAYAFEDYNPSTGADLASKLTKDDYKRMLARAMSAVRFNK